MKKVRRQELESRIGALCKELKLPAVARDAARLATEAARQGTDPLTYLVELLETELCERIERRAKRRTREAGFPVVKTLEGFDFKRAPHLPETLLRRLSGGEYIDRAEPIIFIGEPGTGKTHLASALGEAAARQGRRVKFTTAAGLVTELIEARDAQELGRVVRRYSKVSLLIIDELAYLPLARSDAELLFRVLGESYEFLLLRRLQPETSPARPSIRLCIEARNCLAEIDQTSGEFCAQKVGPKFGIKWGHW